MPTIRALRESDARFGFRCGDEALDRFFRTYAARNQFSLHIGTTYVAEDSDRIVGFVTVAPGSIRADDLPAAQAKGLPRYPLPVLRLARLGVDLSARDKGIGAALLRYVFLRALEMAEAFGCVGVLVDAKPDAVDYYERFGFVALSPLEGQLGSRPQPVPMFLDIGTIKVACGG